MVDEDTISKVAIDSTVKWFKEKGDKQKESVGITITKLVLSIAVLVFVSYMSYSAWRKSEDLIKAKHDLDVLKAKVEHEKAARERETSQKIIDRKSKKIEKLVLEEQKLDEEIIKLHKEYDLERVKIDAIKNWEDMDAYFAELRARRDPSLS